jgi:hypothetical protein
MIDILKRLRVRLFPPVSKRQAALIAKKAVNPFDQKFRVYNKLPEKVHGYNLPTEPCWYVLTSWNDGLDGTILRSSRLLMVSKVSGKLLHDGPAGDEG